MRSADCRLYYILPTDRKAPWLQVPSSADVSQRASVSVYVVTNSLLLAYIPVPGTVRI